MKKKLLSGFLVLTMAMSLAACGKTSATSSTTAATETKTYQEQLAIDQETYAKFVKLGTYKGVEVQVDRSTLTVTDADVQKYIDGILEENGTTTAVKTGTTKTGDAIVLDYSGLLNGVAFSGGTATDASYTVGSGQFISDLDKGLIGLEVGKQYDIPCTFPTDYSSTELAGKAVVFRVTVTAINSVTPAVYDDTFVQSVASTYSSTATTTAEFTTFAKKYLTDKAQTTFDNSKYTTIKEKIISSSTISGYPDAEVQKLIETIQNNVKSEYSSYGSYYGITDYATYLSSVYGYDSEAAFLEYAKEYAQTYLQEKMILTMIAKQENIAVTDDQITEMGTQIASYYGYESFQEIVETYGETIKHEVGYSVLSDSVVKLLLSSAVEK